MLKTFQPLRDPMTYGARPSGKLNRTAGFNRDTNLRYGYRPSATRMIKYNPQNVEVWQN